MSNENPFTDEQQYSCFNCDSAGEYGGYRVHEGQTNWYLGLDPEDVQAYYACERCASMLVDPVLISLNGIEEGDMVEWIGEPVYTGPKHWQNLAIDTGWQRRAAMIKNTNSIWLIGRNGLGLFGAVDPANIRKVEG